MQCSDIREDFIHSNQINNIKHKYTGNFENDRKLVRDQVIELFKSERAGKGKGKLATRVVYCVEKVDDIIIYLKRPAPLNKGFDFEVHISKQLFFGKVRTRPSHKCVITILKDLKKQDIGIFNQVQNLIDEIYNCREENINSIEYLSNNISVTLLLKVIKWLFIEQDITYWSYSGREMFYKELKNV